jgi:hypothetical protein
MTPLPFPARDPSAPEEASRATAPARRRWWYWPAACGVAALAACAGTPPPGWQLNARAAMDQSLQAWFEGNARVEEAEYRRALREASASGRPELVMRLRLMRCAGRVAALDAGEGVCPDAVEVARDGGPAEQAYERYLRGRATPEDVALLPPAQRGAASAGTAVALADIDDPQSRLIAAGVLARQGRAGAAVVALAVDTASAQGWRRPLLAWLRLAQERARAAGDEAEVQRLQRRIDVAGGEGP